METQTLSEVKRIALDWQELYAPANLIRDARTAGLLVEWVLANEQIVSFSGFNHAVEALAAEVLYQDAPKKSAAQIAAEGNAKMFKDYQDSLKPQPSFDERVKVETAKRQAADACEGPSRCEGSTRSGNQRISGIQDKCGRA
jgi:hypothetical protein